MKNIILCCNAGMSTSMLVKKMQKEAETRGIEVDIKAIPVEELDNNLENLGAVLLGPQVRYMLSEVKTKLEKTEIGVEVINTMDYGMMKGGKVLDSALNLMK